MDSQRRILYNSSKDTLIHTRKWKKQVLQQSKRWDPNWERNGSEPSEAHDVKYSDVERHEACYSDYCDHEYKETVRGED